MKICRPHRLQQGGVPTVKTNPTGCRASQRGTPFCVVCCIGGGREWSFIPWGDSLAFMIIRNRIDMDEKRKTAAKTPKMEFPSYWYKVLTIMKN